MSIFVLMDTDLNSYLMFSLFYCIEVETILVYDISQICI